jgi:multiple sugar transport system permease protein
MSHTKRRRSMAPLSMAAGIPAAYALARFTFPFENVLAFLFMSFRFVPFIAFVIPLYILGHTLGRCNTRPSLQSCRN